MTSCRFELRSYAKAGVLDAIRQAGGAVFGVTSEPQTLASEAEREWETQFPIVGDPHHEIREETSERGWLDVFYNEDADICASANGHLIPRGTISQLLSQCTEPTHIVSLAMRT